MPATQFESNHKWNIEKNRATHAKIDFECFKGLRSEQVLGQGFMTRDFETGHFRCASSNELLYEGHYFYKANAMDTPTEGAVHWSKAKIIRSGANQTQVEFEHHVTFKGADVGAYRSARRLFQNGTLVTVKYGPAGLVLGGSEAIELGLEPSEFVTYVEDSVETANARQTKSNWVVLRGGEGFRVLRAAQLSGPMTASDLFLSGYFEILDTSFHRIRISPNREEQIILNWAKSLDDLDK